MKKLLLIFASAGLLIASSQSIASSNTAKNDELQTEVMSNVKEDVWLESLITDTPQEGRELAIKMARKTIGAIQSDPEVKKQVRKKYADDPQMLILSAQVVATEFQTVAEANNYWRK